MLFPLHVLPDFLEEFRILSARTAEVLLAFRLGLGEGHLDQTHDQVIVLRFTGYGCLSGQITIEKHRHFLYVVYAASATRSKTKSAPTTTGCRPRRKLSVQPCAKHDRQGPCAWLLQI